MKYFKDKKTGEVYAYDQEQIDGGWVKEGLAPMTDEEVHAHLNPPKTDEQLKSEAESLATSLRHKADAELIPLQDAIDLDMATDDELARAKELKKFRVLLSRWSYPDDMPEYPSA